ncbi:hypothetical protein IID20_01305 [Patescibacteria group bacterium]|nr:hypothetical protein [Patescibacteria group bacterium]
MIENIKKQLKKIDDDKMYNPQEIIDWKLVLNTQLQPSRFTVYRLIKRGELGAVNLGTTKLPKYFVQGKDLKKFVKKLYKIK